MAALALGGGACSVGEMPDASGKSAGGAGKQGGGEQPDGQDGSDGDVDAGGSDEAPTPGGSDEAEPIDGGPGEDGDDGASIVCPVCDDAYTLCYSTATTTQDTLACEWQWVRCALQSCDLGDARECFIALDACFQLCQTQAECVACSLAGQECF